MDKIQPVAEGQIGDVSKFWHEVMSRAYQEAKQELAAEGIAFYDAKLAYDYQQNREDLRLMCEEGASALVISALADKMASLRHEDSRRGPWDEEEPYWSNFAANANPADVDSDGIWQGVTYDEEAA